MHKKIGILIAVFLAAVIGAVGILISSTDSSENSTNTAMRDMNSDELKTPTETAQNPEATGGTYQQYDEELVAKTEGKKLLFFHAPWCAQCRSIEAGISPETIPKDVSIFKVDYDSRQDLRQKYGVTLQTTFILLDENNLSAEKFVAYETPTFDAVKEALL